MNILFRDMANKNSNIDAIIERIEARMARPPRLLVIDNEPDCIELFRRTFEGCEIVSAETGREGLEIISVDWKRWDCVVVDQRMPGMPGYLVVKHIRLCWPSIFLVFCTAFEWDEETKREMIAWGLPTLLPKGPTGPKAEDAEKLLNFILERQAGRDLE